MTLFSVYSVFYNKINDDTDLIFQEELRICVLPTHLSYDAPWPVRKVPLRCTPHFVTYHLESKTYCVITSTAEPLKSYYRFNGEDKVLQKFFISFNSPEYLSISMYQIFRVSNVEAILKIDIDKCIFLSIRNLRKRSVQKDFYIHLRNNFPLYYFLQFHGKLFQIQKLSWTNGNMSLV